MLELYIVKVKNEVKFKIVLYEGKALYELNLFEVRLFALEIVVSLKNGFGFHEISHDNKKKKVKVTKYITLFHLSSHSILYPLWVKYSILD